ncbi:SCY1 protein kinase [Botrytis cinerea]
MFSSALKSFTSNINSNYSVSSTPSSYSGPWKIYDAKKKSTGKTASVFVLDRKALDAHAGSLGRSSASSMKRATEEVIERLKKEASSLARLRHPSILELVEPVEELRGGGLQFATETVTASLSGLLLEKDEQERAGGIGGRSSRYVTEDSEGGRRRKEVEVDELEIQKGLLQISKALEFLHDNAGLVHGNLTPDAVFVNAKSDWKLSGLSFCSPPDNSTKASSVQPINLSEVLNIDPRLPRSVQINLDYCSPDFVLDSNLNVSADMFSLGLLIVALYNSPHTSPLESNNSVSGYKRLFTSSSTIPSSSNSFLCKKPLPRDMTGEVLPRLITRRPAQRSIHAWFVQGVTIIPKKCHGKKVLPALLEEMKDRELISLILQNVFKIIELLPSARRPFTEKIMPRLKEIFLNNPKPPTERDAAKEAGLMVLLEHIQVISVNCSGKEFKDDILPIVAISIDSPTHALVDAALRSLNVVLPILDFSTIKNELFPVISSVFTKTSSLGIKVRGLEAFVVLCGGSNDPASSNDDKYTMQEKIVPLIRAIKTKEPAVAVAALNVLRQIGNIADAEFVAMDILPILWNMSLGPLLNLQQFQSFMELIKSLSVRVESEQTKKLQELSGTNGAGVRANGTDDFMSFGAASAFPPAVGSDDPEMDFERLVKGGIGAPSSNNALDASWDANPTSPHAQQPQSAQPKPSFAWSTPSPTAPTYPSNSINNVLRPQQATSRTLPNSRNRFSRNLTTQILYNRNLHFLNPNPLSHNPIRVSSTQTFNLDSELEQCSCILNPQSMELYTYNRDLIAHLTTPLNSSFSSMSNSMSSLSMNQMNQARPALNSSQSASGAFSSFSLPPPPSAGTGGTGNYSAFGSTSGSGLGSGGMGIGMGQQRPVVQQQQQQQPQKKSGLDAYESLL